jgi:adenylosuccinate synthase
LAGKSATVAFGRAERRHRRHRWTDGAIPSGALYPGTMCLGQRVVVDLAVLQHEIDELSAAACRAPGASSYSAGARHPVHAQVLDRS